MVCQRCCCLFVFDGGIGRTVEVPALTAPSAPPLLDPVSIGIVILELVLDLGCGGLGWFRELLVVVNRIGSLDTRYMYSYI